MAEEHGFQAPEGHRLCANNCGFFGSSATMNMCSKCYQDIQMKEERESIAKTALSASPSVSSTPNPVQPSRPVIEPVDFSMPTVVETTEPVEVQVREVTQVTSQPNRCLNCRKRVGLTGFRCRCGSMFCGSHRYPEQHGCTFDYKKVGKEAIAKANPLIKAEKLRKI